MSATLDTDRVAALLGGGGSPAPVVASDGRSHPVDIRWRPPDPRDRPAEAVSAAVLRGAARRRRRRARVPGRRGRHPPGRRVAGPVVAGRRRRAPAVRCALARRAGPGAGPVAARTSTGGARHRHRRDQPHRGRRARSWSTAAGAQPPLRPPERADPPAHRAHLPGVGRPAGRAGRAHRHRASRTACGPSGEHAPRRPFAPPEIESVDLAGLALELAVWGRRPSDLAFLDPPPARALAEARACSSSSGALDADGRVTTDAAGRWPSCPCTPAWRAWSSPPPSDGLGWRRVRAGRPARGARRAPGPTRRAAHDVAERVRLIADPRLGHPAADAGAVQLVRRRAGELGAGERSRPATVDVDLAACGPVLALAYPDRLAQARGGGRFRLRNGAAAWLPAGDALAGEAFLVVADLDAPATGDDDLRIRMAAGLDEADVEAAAGGAIEEVGDAGAGTPPATTCGQRAERRLGALVLASREAPGPAGERRPPRALVDQVRAHPPRRAALERRRPGRCRPASASPAARSAATGPTCPTTPCSPSLDDWLAPRLAGATGRADLERSTRRAPSADTVGHHRLAELDRLAPPTVVLASGRAGPVDYTRRPPDDLGAGPGPVRHHRPPDRGRRAGAARRAAPLPRRPAGPGHRRPPRLLGRLVDRGPQGDGRPLPQARLAPRPGDRLAVAPEDTATAVSEPSRCTYRCGSVTSEVGPTPGSPGTAGSAAWRSSPGCRCRPPRHRVTV